jgi:hypothetical protein
MPGGVLGSVGVVEIRDALVPVLGKRAAQIGAGHEWPLAAHLNLGLEPSLAGSQSGLGADRGRHVTRADRWSSAGGRLRDRFA